MAKVTAHVRCTAHPTASASWLSVEIPTGHPWPVVLRVPAEDVTTVPSDEASDLERSMVESLLSLGRRPEVGAEDRLAVEVGETGHTHALVRVRTVAGPQVCRVPLKVLVLE